MLLGIDFWVDYVGFGVPKWSQVGTKMGSKIDFSENMKNAFGASPLMPNWVQGIDLEAKNRSKNEVKIGRHLGIDFCLILVDLGSQDGREHRTKIDKKCHRKTDQKLKDNKINKTSI